MAQISNIDRKTIVMRVPRKYRSLMKAYAAWLKTYPDQAKLWQCEEYLSQTLEDTIKPESPTGHRKLTEAQRQVFKILKHS
jgi:hypothetical protein